MLLSLAARCTFSELKAAFIRTLNLDDEHALRPENSHLFAAIGSALNSKKDAVTTLIALKQRLERHSSWSLRLPVWNRCLKTGDYDAFTSRHGNNHVETGDLSTYEGNCYLGIDAGSTTTKIALVSEDGKLLYSFYSNNNGSPLATAIRSIQEIYRLLPESAHIVHSCSTGYGEALLKAALMLG